jgi:replicative DNA helicase
VLSDGSLATIEELFGRKRARLLTLGGDYRFWLTEPSAFVCDGVKPVYRVRTGLGRSIETTLTHPFLTPSGWRSLGSLKPGDQIALPRALRIFGAERMRDCDVKLLAYLIAQQHNRPLHPAAQIDFRDAILESGGPLEIAPSAARQISLPGAIFKLNRPQLALFLNRLFAAGGHISQRGISYQAPSRKLARHVQHLLLRFGVIAGLKRARGSWLLEISDPESIERFSSEISICGQQDRLEALLEAGGRRPPLQTAGDILWDQITSIEPAGNKSVYDLTIPNTHNFVANDICVHNTALALNIAQYAARNGYVIGIFSLEMPIG